MTAIKYNLPKTTEELNKTQDKAIKAANSARKLIQQALVATVHHLATNHDVRVARRLVDGLSETVRGKALVAWLVKYGHLTIGKVDLEVEGKTIKVETFDGIKGDADAHNQLIRDSWEEAKATMWWTAIKADNAYKGFDLNEYLKAGIAQLQKAQKKVEEGKADPSTVSTEVNDVVIKAIIAFAKFDVIGEVANPDEVQAEAA